MTMEPPIYTYIYVRVYIYILYIYIIHILYIHILYIHMHIHVLWERRGIILQTSIPAALAPDLGLWQSGLGECGLVLRSLGLQMFGAPEVAVARGWEHDPNDSQCPRLSKLVHKNQAHSDCRISTYFNTFGQWSYVQHFEARFAWSLRWVYALTNLKNRQWFRGPKLSDAILAAAKVKIEADDFGAQELEELGDWDWIN
jgi:hypothetical protein